MALAAIWSNSDDPTVGLLSSALEAEGHEALRIVTGPQTVDEIGFSLENDGKLELEVAGRAVESLNTVFYRKPVPPGFDYEESHARFLAREAMQGLESVLSLTPAKWVNHPKANRAAADKLGNLVLAHRLGLHVPQSWAGTKTPGRSVGKRIGKPVTHGLMTRSDGAAMVFASRLPEGFDPMRRTEPGVPMLIQEEVHADADVRATVVGAQVLVAERPRTPSELDWRSSTAGADWTMADLPDNMAAKLRALVSSRGLSFGACDLLRTGNDYTFLEMNPNGQWGWLEIEAGLQISKALAGLVVEHK